MKQLRYLIDVEVDKATNVKQANGTIIASYETISEFKIQPQELTDEVSASVYGADVNRMYRISSPRHELESFLKSKLNNTSDNISLYGVLFNGSRYRIVAVRNNWADIVLM